MVLPAARARALGTPAIAASFIRCESARSTSHRCRCAELRGACRSDRPVFERFGGVSTTLYAMGTVLDAEEAAGREFKGVRTGLLDSSAFLA